MGKIRFFCNEERSITTSSGDGQENMATGRCIELPGDERELELDCEFFSQGRNSFLLTVVIAGMKNLGDLSKLTLVYCDHGRDVLRQITQELAGVKQLTEIHLYPNGRDDGGRIKEEDYSELLAEVKTINIARANSENPSVLEVHGFARELHNLREANRLS